MRSMRTSSVVAFIAVAALVSCSALAQDVATPRGHSAQVWNVQKTSGGYLGIGGLDISPERAKALNLKEERGVEVSSLAEDGPAAKAGIKQGDVGLEFTGTSPKALNLKEERGVEVSSLAEDGPAAKAGIKQGDVVLEFNGQPVEGTAQFSRLVRETPVGRHVKIAVWRSGAAQTLTATVGEHKQTTVFGQGDGGWNFNMPEIQPMPNIEIPRFQMTLQNPMLGIRSEEHTSELQSLRHL